MSSGCHMVLQALGEYYMLYLLFVVFSVCPPRFNILLYLRNFHLPMVGHRNVGFPAFLEPKAPVGDPAPPMRCPGETIRK